MAYTDAMLLLAHVGPDQGAHHGSSQLLTIAGAAVAAVILGLVLRNADSHRA